MLKKTGRKKPVMSYPQPVLSSGYHIISRYFTRLEFMKLFSERLNRLISRHYDDTRAMQLLRLAANKRIEFINQENYFINRFFSSSDIGRQCFKRFPKHFELFVSEVIAQMKNRETAGYSYIDISSIFIYLAHFQKVYLVKEDVMEMAIRSIAGATYTLAGTGFTSPYKLDIMAAPLVSEIGKKININIGNGYSRLVGIFLRAITDIKANNRKYERPEITCVKGAVRNDRMNQLERLCMIFSLEEYEVNSYLRDIPNWGEKSMEMLSALQKMKNDKEFYTVNSNAVIEQMKKLEDDGVLQTYTDLTLTKIFNTHSLSDYVKVPYHTYKEMDIGIEIVEPESYVSAFGDTFARIGINCEDLRELKDIEKFIYAGADFLMTSERVAKHFGGEEYERGVKLEIHLFNVENIKLSFIEEVKKLETFIRSRYNKEFVITIAYAERAMHIKGGKQLPEYFRVISDIHTDVNADKGYRYDFGDDFVLNCGDTAGDCMTERDWIRTYIKTGVSVAGNHMGYSSGTPSLDGEANKETVGNTTHPYNTKNGQIYYLVNNFPLKSDVRYLSNSVYEDEKMVIIGNTLYTDFKLFGEKNKDHCMMVASKSLNDFKYCTTYVRGDTGSRKRKESEITGKGKKGGSGELVLGKVKRFTVEEHAKLFKACIGFIENRLKEMRKNNDRRVVIIVTHHAPLLYSIEDKYKNDSLSAAFASDLREFIKQYPEIRLWVHGHTHHRGVDYIYSGCRFVSEPFGYYTENFNDLRGGLISDYGKRIKIKDVLNKKKSWEDILNVEIQQGTVQVYQD